MRIINLGILAHVDAGKTTITEQLLFRSGKTRTLGRVDEGTSVSDSLPSECRRGISVKASCVSIEHGGVKINIIDTPGHIDFAGEVERALCALDAAVLVVSAVEGLQSHTRIIRNALARLKIPVLFCINKLDRAGSDYKKVIEKLETEFSDNIVLLNTCKNEGGDSVVIDASPQNGELLENMLLALQDDSLTEKFLEGDIGGSDISAMFYERCKRGECCAAVLTCAKHGGGIDFLMDKIPECLPDSSYLDCGTPCGVVFKTEHDRVMGLCAYIRMFSGELHNRDTVSSQGKEVGKISQIRLPDGSKFVDSGTLSAGETGAVYGLSDICCGETVGEDALNRKCSVCTALMMVGVSPENAQERPLLMKALSELNEEDPLLNFEYSSIIGEMYINITGVIQLEILGEIIAERYGLTVCFSEPNVIFRETPKIAATGFESYTMPKPCWAKVELLIEPLERGAGVEFRSVIKEKTLPYRYQHHVEQSVLRDCVVQGIYGWQVTDARITLTGGEYHSIHTHPLDFFVATPVAFLRALQACETVLLEPYVRVTMCAAQQYLGTVIGNVLEMRGEFDSPVIENEEFTLTAYLPVQDSVFYPSKFSSVTSGTGTYYSEFFEYRECPAELYKTLPRMGVDPLDRARWILHCRSALGDK